MLDYRKHKNKNRWSLAVFTILAILLLVLFGNFSQTLLTGPLIFFTQPFWQVSDNLGELAVTSASGLGKSRSILLAENKSLREELNKLKTLLLAKNNVEIDNAKLRTIFGRSQGENKPIVARAIFLPNFVPYNNLLLDVGKNNNLRPLKKGDLVVVDGTVLIGRLAFIDETYSKAQLISTETNLPVVIGSKNIPATAVGSGAGNFTVILPKDTPIDIGDRVAAPLFNNYLIGSVGHIEKLTSRPTQTILVRTSVNLFQLKWVEIYDAKT